MLKDGVDKVKKIIVYERNILKDKITNIRNT